MNWQMIVVSVLIVIVTFGVMNVVLQKIDDIPSEEKCQGIIGYANEQKEYAEKHFCEYNETGWHFNKTKFMRSPLT